MSRKAEGQGIELCRSGRLPLSGASSPDRSQLLVWDPATAPSHESWAFVHSAPVLPLNLRGHSGPRGVPRGIEWAEGCWVGVSHFSKSHIE